MHNDVPQGGPTKNGKSYWQQWPKDKNHHYAWDYRRRPKDGTISYLERPETEYRCHWCQEPWEADEESSYAVVGSGPGCKNPACAVFNELAGEG